MIKNLVILFSAIFVGVGIGIAIFWFNPALFRQSSRSVPLLSGLAEKEVIGFLPYWLLTTAKQDYSPYITTLTYFGLQVDTDGSILKMASEQEADPGWEALRSGKITPFLQSAQNHGVSLSLTVLNTNDHSISDLIDQPVPHAQKLVSELNPILSKYHFSDLNLDIEYGETASESARQNFTQFIKAVRNSLNPNYSLTVEITSDDLLRAKLVDPAAIGSIAENVIVMAYDFHAQNSFVTGGVAPIAGAGIVSENDVATAVVVASRSIPAEKIILGIPLYGYEWETLGMTERSGIIPGSGVATSNRRMETMVAACATCSAQFNQQDQEVFVEFNDPETGTNHQLVYPDKRSTAAKIDLANSAGLGGVALWSLGYEGQTILDPLKEYK